MKKFIIRFCSFSLPFAAVGIFCVGYLTYHRELDSYDAMAQKNQRDGALIGLAHSDPMRYVKQRVITAREPRVIALGTSRVLSFRDFFFKEPSSFYNCGRSVDRIKDLRAFMEAYPTDSPEVVIVGLDQNFFAANWDDLSGDSREYEADITVMGRFIKLSKSLLKDATKKRLALAGPNELTKGFIGATARIYHEGYRADGSYCYGKWIGQEQKHDNYQFEMTMDRIAKRSKNFTDATDVNEAAVRELEAFLDLCESKGIHVVTFLPPYAHKVMERFAEEPEHFPYIFKLYERLNPMFEKRGLRLFDYTDIASVNSNDYETIDGFHGSEPCYLKIIHRMAMKDSVLARHLDVAHTGRLLQSLYSARQIVWELDEVGRKDAN